MTNHTIGPPPQPQRPTPPPAPLRTAYPPRRSGHHAAGNVPDQIRTSAQKGDNVMPGFVDGALAGCTLGEMVQAPADIDGRYAGGPQ